MNETNVHGTYAGFVSRTLGLIMDIVLISVFVAVTVWITVQFFDVVGIDLARCNNIAPVSSFATFKNNICLVARFSLYVLGVAAFPVYLFLFWWLGGQTFGMQIAGVRVVRVDGDRLKAHNALRRLFGFVACVLTLGVGFAWCMIDTRRQGWHDKFARTYVVYWRPDERLIRVARLRASLPGSPARRSGLPAMDPPLPASPLPNAPASSSPANETSATLAGDS